MKEGWKMNPFTSCILKVAKKGEIKSSEYNNGSKYPIVSQDNQLICGYTDNFDYVYKFEKPVVIFGDHTRVVKYVDFDFAVGADGVKILKPIVDLNARFFYFFLKSIDMTSKGYARHFRFLKEIPIPVPPLPEQNRLVEKLDKLFFHLDALQRNAQHAIDDAKELFQSKLEQLMTPKEGWEVKKLGEVCEYYKVQEKHDDLPYIGMENIGSFTGSLIDKPQMQEVVSSTFAFKKGQVLFGRLRPYLGKVFLADFNGQCSTEIFPIQTKGDMLPKFLFYWFLNKDNINRINKTCRGARMPRANMNDLLLFDFPLPHLHEQNSIVSELDSLSNQIKHLQSNFTRQLASIEELKQSILHEAFEGNL